MTTRDAMAEFYRSRGMDCLPTSDAEKKPLCRFREFWDSPVPSDLMARFPSKCLQIITGRSKGLLVIDLDGPEAIAWWDHWPERKPSTWVTHSGGGGQHWWFRVAKDLAKPLPKAVLWKGAGSHSAVERLCDKSLVMAPPSVHPTTGKVYRFLDAQHSPKKLPMPAEVPGWLLSLPDVTPKPVPVAVPFRRPEVVHADSAGRYRAEDVRAAIPDLIELARSWGIRFTGVERDGWAECHAVDRPDEKPSAAIHRATGAYRDLGSTAKLGIFDLASAMGGLGMDWREAVAILGERYRARSA